MAFYRCGSGGGREFNWTIAVSSSARKGSSTAYSSASATFYINGVAIGSTSASYETVHSDWGSASNSASGTGTL